MKLTVEIKSLAHLLRVRDFRNALAFVRTAPKIHYSTFTLVLRGVAKPEPATVRKIAKKLDVTPAQVDSLLGITR